MDWLEMNIFVIFGMDVGLLLIQVRRDQKIKKLFFTHVIN